MRIYIFLLSFFLITPVFATFTEGGDGGYCTLPDGSFREECMYMSGIPTSLRLTVKGILQDGSWQSVSLNGKAITGANLKFTERRFTAKICNNMNGVYGAFRDRLTFFRSISTMMYCEGDIMQLEDAMRFTRATLILGAEDMTIKTRKGDTIIWKKVSSTGENK